VLVADSAPAVEVEAEDVVVEAEEEAASAAEPVPVAWLPELAPVLEAALLLEAAEPELFAPVPVFSPPFSVV